MNEINVVGKQILDVMMTAGYWVTLVAGAGQIINSIAKRDAQQALKQALSYGIAFASLYILQWLLNMIRRTFA